MFINPFKSHDVSEFPNVLIPLDQATHRGSISSHRRVSLAALDRREDKTATKENKPEDSPREPENDASSGVVNHGMTLESLKAEIEADVAASDTDTPYDRTSHNLPSTTLRSTKISDYYEGARIH